MTKYTSEFIPVFIPLSRKSIEYGYIRVKTNALLQKTAPEMYYLIVRIDFVCVRAKCGCIYYFWKQNIQLVCINTSQSQYRLCTLNTTDHNIAVGHLICPLFAGEMYRLSTANTFLTSCDSSDIQSWIFFIYRPTLFTFMAVA